MKLKFKIKSNLFSGYIKSHLKKNPKKKLIQLKKVLKIFNNFFGIRLLFKNNKKIIKSRFNVLNSFYFKKFIYLKFYFSYFVKFLKKRFKFFFPKSLISYYYNILLYYFRSSNFKVIKKFNFLNSIKYQIKNINYNKKNNKGYIFFHKNIVKTRYYNLFLRNYYNIFYNLKFNVKKLYNLGKICNKSDTYNLNPSLKNNLLYYVFYNLKLNDNNLKKYSKLISLFIYINKLYKKYFIYKKYKLSYNLKKKNFKTNLLRNKFYVYSKLFLFLSKINNICVFFFYKKKLNKKYKKYFYLYFYLFNSLKKILFNFYIKKKLYNFYLIYNNYLNNILLKKNRLKYKYNLLFKSNSFNNKYNKYNKFKYNRNKNKFFKDKNLNKIKTEKVSKRINFYNKLIKRKKISFYFRNKYQFYDLSFFDSLKQFNYTIEKTLSSYFNNKILFVSKFYLKNRPFIKSSSLIADSISYELRKGIPINEVLGDIRYWFKIDKKRKQRFLRYFFKYKMRRKLTRILRYIYKKNKKYYSKFLLNYKNLLNKKEKLKKILFLRNKIKRYKRVLLRLKSKKNKLNFMFKRKSFLKFNKKIKLNPFKHAFSEVKNLDKKFIKPNFYNISGFKILCSGRPYGQPRTLSYLRLFKEMPLSTLSKKIDYSFNYAITKYGVIGVKVWILFN